MRKLLLLTSFAILATLSSPARAQFCPGAAPWVFDDVPAGDLFCEFITWAAERGITQGCLIIDANHRLFCPTDAVTRSQMAAFVKRLGDVRVEAVATGPGLTGGPITSVGTINLATTQLLPTTSCANNQIARWNGSAWACSSDANSGGTVTSVGSGTGLAGGPITASGTLSLLTGYQLPQGCTNGQVAKSNGSNAWTCASDVSSGGTVTSVTAGNGLTGGTITTSGTIAVDPASATLTNNFFRQGGNAFAATAVLGTTNNNAIDVRANGSRVMRYEPNATSPNIVGGSPGNTLAAGVRGATLAGGGTTGDASFGVAAVNRVTDLYGTVGGGATNQAGNNSGPTTDAAFATVGGGLRNTASGTVSTVAGGDSNAASGGSSAVGGGLNNGASGQYAVVAGGHDNIASATSSIVGGGTGNQAVFQYAVVAGGLDNNSAGAASAVGGGGGNQAIGDGSTIAGGNDNIATGFSSTIAGGSDNFATGAYSTVAGGRDNFAGATYSVAMGRRAKAMGQGSFAFADGNDFDFSSSTDNAFRVRATGGVRFVVDIDGTGATTWSCLLTAGNSWSCSSDRNVKQNLVELDGKDVLDKLSAMPVYQWQPKGANSRVRHYGPMAQDFHAAFGLGDDDKMIGFQDADGVALAAIKGLNEKVESQAREIEALHARYGNEIAELRRAVEVLLARTTPEGRTASR